jgi:hypothetical protein
MPISDSLIEQQPSGSAQFDQWKQLATDAGLELAFQVSSAGQAWPLRNTEDAARALAALKMDGCTDNFSIRCVALAANGATESTFLMSTFVRTTEGEVVEVDRVRQQIDGATPQFIVTEGENRDRNEYVVGYAADRTSALRVARTSVRRVNTWSVAVSRISYDAPGDDWAVKPSRSDFTDVLVTTSKMPPKLPDIRRVQFQGGHAVREAWIDPRNGRTITGWVAPHGIS